MNVKYFNEDSLHQLHSMHADSSVLVSVCTHHPVGQCIPAQLLNV